MGYSKAEIAAALQRKNIDPETGESTYKQQIRGTLEKKGVYLPEHVGEKLATIPVSAVQEMGRLTSWIPGSPAWLGKKLMPKMRAAMPAPLQQVEQTTEQLPQRFPYQAGIGRALTDIGYGTPLMAGAGAVGGPVAAMGAGSLLGAMQAKPGERWKGAAIGAVLGAPTPYMPKLATGGIGFLRGLSPRKYAKSIMENLPATRNPESVLNELGRGNDLELNAKFLANKIKLQGRFRKGKSTENFEDINRRAGIHSIYENQPIPSKNSYRMLEKWERSPIDNYTSTLKDAHDDFMNIPTFDKAHKLQSTLGDTAYQILKSPYSNYQERDIGRRFLEAQRRLRNDMHNHLNGVDPTGNLTNDYKKAVDYHREEVIPYENKYINPIVRGKVTNPRNLTTIFKNPEIDIAKIVGDLGPTSQDQIVFNELYHKNPTAKNILNNYDKLEKKGLQSYVSPKLEQQINELKNTHAQDEFLKHIGNKPTAENILKAGDKLENKDLLHRLHPSLQEQLRILKRKAIQAKWIKRGAAILGAGYLAKKLLPSHLAQQIIP